MKEESSQNQGLWWLPIARRITGWGLVMACLWGWFPFLFGGELGLLVWLRPELLEETPDEAGFGSGLALVALTIPLVVTCIWMIGGAVTGAFTGFFAPPTEPKNPLKSPFFRSVGRQAFWFWFWSTIGATFCFLLLRSALEVVGLDGMGGLLYCLYLATLAATPVLSLWRALNRTLKGKARVGNAI